MKVEVEARIKLIADEGMVLTDERIYGRIIFLSGVDKPENWREIKEEEYRRGY